MIARKVPKPMQIPSVITGRENPGGLRPPLDALIAFYRAFNARDLEGLSANWAHEADVAMNNPVGGIARGWNAIRQVYERICTGPAAVRVEFYDFTLHETDGLWYAVGRERGEARVGGLLVPLAIRTTRIYRLLGEEWRQVHHHGSMDDAALLARYQAAVVSSRARR